MTSCTGSARRILGILKKVSRVENWTPNDKGWLSLARGGLGQVLHEIGGRWKNQNRKTVPLSPYVEEPLKVIKSFVPELSHKCFFVFRDSYVLCYIYIYIYIYEHPMYISHIHVYGYGTIWSLLIYSLFWNQCTYQSVYVIIYSNLIPQNWNILECCKFFLLIY